MNTQSLFESSYLARYLLLNAVDITDYKVFPEREIQNSPPAFHFLYSGNDDAMPVLNESVVAYAKTGESMDQFLERNATVAFLVLKNDRVLYERYYNGYSRASICTSFSTVKSFVSALIGIALHEKLIAGLDDAVSKYLPELTSPHWSAITIRHLVSMSSGLKYKAGSFFPWSDEPRTYYALDLRSLASEAKKLESPGQHFHYNNYNLILLGMLLERVTGENVSTYLQERIWKPLGMEFPASWSLDSQQNGMEKMESGLNARAIDFAKFGHLYLRQGNWDGKQVIPESWVAESTIVDPDAKWTNYKYLWWIPHSGKGRFMAVGNLGQFIYIAPDKDCMILRFGRGKPNTVILAGNYGEAGAFDLYGDEYGLPRMITGTNSMWYRGYGQPEPETVIVVGFERDYAGQFFKQCEYAGTVTNRYNVKNEETKFHTGLYICREPRQPWSEMWPKMQWFQ
ncbi:MAG: serine hydrolase domain-containing protein [Anaerolineales bacterium]